MLVASLSGPPRTGGGSLATTSPPMLPEICASALPANAENPAAVARMTTIVPSLDRYIRLPFSGEVAQWMPPMTLTAGAKFPEAVGAAPIHGRTAQGHA